MRIELRPIQRQDLDRLPQWVAGPVETVQWSGPWNFRFPLEPDQLADFFLADRTPEGWGRRQFKAVEAGTDRMIGQIGFSRVWEPTRAAHLGPVIVDPAERGRGIGRQMVERILEMGFGEMRMHRIELVVFSFNQAAIACYTRAGFRQEGLMRDIVQVDGSYWHWTLMSILSHEWNG